MSDEPFDVFLKAHPLYGAAYERLLAASRLLGTSAQLVYELHPETLGPVADEILSFVESAYPGDYAEAYLARVNRMAKLQERFDANPTSATLSDGSAVPAEAYSLALLLSIVFTNHRFEILEALKTFLQQLPADAAGTIASIGCGTGYELKLAAERLPAWSIEGYDTDAEMRAGAKRLLQFFRVAKPVDFRVEFNLNEPPQPSGQHYDAIILCEVLEHLPDPARALATLRECLTDGGTMFVTMAINIAQEDHIFLYPDIESCRRQISESGLKVKCEWIAPQTIRFPPQDRKIGFKKGNYIAIVSRDERLSRVA